MKFLISHRAGHSYSKYHLRVNSDISSFDFAVASLNKEYGELEVFRLSLKSRKRLS